MARIMFIVENVVGYALNPLAPTLYLEKTVVILCIHPLVHYEVVRNFYLLHGFSYSNPYSGSKSCSFYDGTLGGHTLPCANYHNKFI